MTTTAHRTGRPVEQVIDMLGDVAPPAVTDPGEGKLAHLLVPSRIRG